MKKSLSFLLPALLFAVACGNPGAAPSSPQPPEVEAAAPGNVHQMGYTNPSVVLISDSNNYRQYFWNDQVKWYSTATPYLNVAYEQTFNRVATLDLLFTTNAAIFMEWDTFYPGDKTPVQFIQWVRNVGNLYSASNGWEEPIPAIAQWTKNIPIVVITDVPSQASAALAAGATQVISKSNSTPEQVAALVDQYQAQLYTCDGDWWLPNCGQPQ
jgi:hypothetical protein